VTSTVGWSTVIAGAGASGDGSTDGVGDDTVGPGVGDREAVENGDSITVAVGRDGDTATCAVGVTPQAASVAAERIASIARPLITPFWTLRTAAAFRPVDFRSAVKGAHLESDPALKCGLIVTTGDPRAAAGLAAEAEAAGWDGVFYWDGVAIGDGDTYDPWVVMAAMAMTTERVRLGAIVTPPSRRRPWKLAERR
jgi:alkanesulfonate monooxygenase SsuD/methylene tetrahydromethanopterin reductase-like flavin-dependent oxidoreductase (luciferase family)